MEITIVVAIAITAFIAYRMLVAYIYLRKVAAVATYLPEAVPLLLQTSTMIFICGTGSILTIGMYVAGMLDEAYLVYKIASYVSLFIFIALYGLADYTRHEERSQLKHAIATHAAQAA